MRESLDAIRHLESAVTGADWTEGIVLRYGGFYGPGTGLSRDGVQTELMRGGSSRWSATAAACGRSSTSRTRPRPPSPRSTHGGRGIYNIVDDDPAPVAEWLPAAAEAVGARRPRHVPRWLGRLVAGEAATVMMTEMRGASNEKAKRELGWQPRHASWREGFAQAAA